MAITYNTGAKGSRGRAVSDQYAGMLRGFSELIEELQEFARGADETHRREALTAGGEILMNRAREIVPYSARRDGLLQKEGIVFGQLNGEKIDIGWTKEGFYGRFLEMGTSKMSPIPHLRPAYEQKKTEIFSEMLTVMKLK